MAQSVAAPHRRGFLSTLRTDAWWFEPVLVFVSLSIFFGWLTISIFMDTVGHFEIGPYITPVFEPKFFGAKDNWLISPGMIVLLGPVPFRATCYYYRRAYYRSYLMSPPACAVGDVGKTYKGESIFPFILQNLHRFTMYVALIFVPILWFGALHGFWNTEEIGPQGQELSTGFGIGLGSIILCVNAFCLMMYTFSCHSLRHFVGGGLNCFSSNGSTRFRKKIWDQVTRYNIHHRFWAWTSLLVIVFTDVYIRLVASGHLTDPNTWKGF
jgi:hypothetical protein